MAKLLKLLQIKIPQKYGDIFFKSKGCCKTIEAMPYGPSFGALDSTMATLLKFDYCRHFRFYTLQTVPQLAAESRQLM